MSRRFLETLPKTALTYIKKNRPVFDHLKSLAVPHDLTCISAIPPDLVPYPDGMYKILYSENIIKALTTNNTGSNRGQPSTISAIKDFANKCGVVCDESNIAFGHGIISGVKDILANRRGKVLLTVPNFGFYFQINPSQTILMPLRSENNYQIDPAELEQYIQHFNIRTLLTCDANNPLGIRTSVETAQKVLEVTSKHNVLVISDGALMTTGSKQFDDSSTDPSKLLSYEPGESSSDELLKENLPYAQVDPNSSVSIFSLCKSIAIPKHSLVIGPQKVIGIFEIAGGQSLITQKMVKQALERNPQNIDYYNKCNEYLRANINLVKLKLAEINKKFAVAFGDDETSNIQYVTPLIEDPSTPNMYVLKFSLKGKEFNKHAFENDLDIQKWLASFGVGGVAGSAFGIETSEMCIRLSMSVSYHELNLALNQISKAAENVKNGNISLAKDENLLQPTSSSESKTTNGPVSNAKASTLDPTTKVAKRFLS